eukprot:scaffold1299_cov385-Pavlova_lutheri.AAC.2
MDTTAIQRDDPGWIRAFHNRDMESRMPGHHSWAASKHVYMCALRSLWDGMKPPLYISNAPCRTPRIGRYDLPCTWLPLSQSAFLMQLPYERWARIFPGQLLDGSAASGNIHTRFAMLCPARVKGAGLVCSKLQDRYKVISSTDTSNEAVADPAPLCKQLT